MKSRSPSGHTGEGGATQIDSETNHGVAYGRYETLLSAGVRIYEYQPTTLHAKTFVADGLWTAIGTANFDNRSLAYNTEDMLTVRDAALGATMDSLFLADLPYSEEIKLPAFRRRPWWMHIRERGASVLADLL